MKCGCLITFEGVDGCGKSTQCRLLAERLTSLGASHLVTREPGGTALGVRIRSIVLTSAVKPPDFGLSPMAEALLFAADRAQHVQEVIRPALEAGRMVLCDRYTDSTRAFQGYGRQREQAVIVQLVALATGGLTPDLTLLFDLPVAESQERMHRHHQETPGTGPDRLDTETLEFHERVRQGYLTLAAAEPKRFRVLDARHGIETLHREVRSIVSDFTGIGLT